MCCEIFAKVNFYIKGFRDRECVVDERVSFSFVLFKERLSGGTEELAACGAE